MNLCAMPAPPTLHPARVVARHPEGLRGQRITLAVPPAVAAAYTAPGQYCELGVGDQTGYFAIAGAPGSPDAFEFYVQDNGGSAAALLRGPLGATVHISLPAGAGYGLDAALAHGGPLYALATGSGWYGLRSALWAIAEAGRSATTYAGFRHPPDALDTPGQQQLRDRRFAIHLCLSRPPDGWTGRRGHVQRALDADAPDLTDAWVLGCGQPEMLIAAREICARRGLAPARFLTNY